MTVTLWILDIEDTSNIVHTHTQPNNICKRMTIAEYRATKSNYYKNALAIRNKQAFNKHKRKHNKNRRD